MLTLTNLEEKGAFIRPELVLKKAIWKHIDKDNGDPENGYLVDDEIEFFVKQASWLEFSELVQKIKTDEKGKQLNNEALAVAACIRIGDNGEQEIPYSKVIEMDTNLYYTLRNAVFEIYAPKN